MTETLDLLGGAPSRPCPEPAAPSFRARAPWWGGDLQTLRNFLLLQRPRLPAGPKRRLLLALGDGSGDRLAACLHGEGRLGRRPLVVLLHGLTGCEDSSYVRAGARISPRSAIRSCASTCAGRGRRGQAAAASITPGAGPTWVML